MMKKKLGQVFLRDKNIVNIIINESNLNENDTVLEIGPGNGVLTRELLGSGAKVIAIEKSSEFYDLLETLFRNEIDNGKLTLIHGDALKIDFPYFNKVVSNIPYNISSPITFKLLNYKFDLAIIMYQKEFAERIVAKPGNKNYSRLSVAVYYYADAQIVRRVPKTCFYPVPKVDSAIVKLIPHKKFQVSDEEKFFNLLKILFSQRRKMIRNILKMEDIPYGDKRVEELSPEKIAELAEFLISKNLI